MPEQFTQSPKTTPTLKSSRSSVSAEISGVLGSLRIADTEEPLIPRCPLCNDVGVIWVKCADGVKRRFSCSCQDAAVDYRKFARLPEFKRVDLLPITQEFIENFKSGSGQWLSYFGDSGCGKTTQACLVVESLTTRQKNPVRCRFYTTSTVISELSSLKFDYDRTQQYIDKMNRYELIVLDDLLDCFGRPNYEEFLIRLLKDRYAAKKSTVITCEGDLTNLVKTFPNTGRSLAGRIIERSGKYLYRYKDAIDYRMSQYGL